MKNKISLTFVLLVAMAFAPSFTSAYTIVDLNAVENSNTVIAQVVDATADQSATRVVTLLAKSTENTETLAIEELPHEEGFQSLSFGSLFTAVNVDEVDSSDDIVAEPPEIAAPNAAEL